MYIHTDRQTERNEIHTNERAKELLYPNLPWDEKVSYSLLASESVVARIRRTQKERRERSEANK